MCIRDRGIAMCEDTNWPHAMGTSVARGSAGFIGFTAPAAAGVSAAGSTPCRAR